MLVNLEINFDSQIDGLRLAIQNRRFVFTLGHRFQRRLNKKGMTADDFFLNDVSVFIDNRFDHDDSTDMRLPGENRRR